MTNLLVLLRHEIYFILFVSFFVSLPIHLVAENDKRLGHWGRKDMTVLSGYNRTGYIYVFF